MTKVCRSLRKNETCFYLRGESGNVYLWYLSLALKDGEKYKDYERKKEHGDRKSKDI